MDKCQCVSWSTEAEGFVPCSNTATQSLMVKSAATGLQWLVKSCDQHATRK